MALRWILLCLLASVVFAQDDPPRTVMFGSGMDVIVLPENETIFQPDPSLISVQTRVQNFFTEQASNARDDHFYCLGTPIEVEFPEDQNMGREIVFVTNDDSTQFPTMAAEVWTLVFQYPVLSYLDTTRKAALLNLIAQLAAESGDTSGFTSNAICLGAFETFDVSDYSEGVVFRIYLSESIMRFSLPIGVSAEEYIEALNANFISNFDAAADSSDNRVQRFRGRPAIYIPAWPGFGDNIGPDANVHPGSSLPPGEDPTLFAVYRGSLPRNATLGEVLGEAGRSGASNPDPINFGLEAGDIVFAVFGSIFLFIVAALAVLGFVIHPFFLS